MVRQQVAASLNTPELADRVPTRSFNTDGTETLSPQQRPIEVATECLVYDQPTRSARNQQQLVEADPLLVSTTALLPSPCPVPAGDSLSGTVLHSQLPSVVQVSGPSFQSPMLPLHSFVPLKVKDKIWNMEFVDLATLFEDSPESQISLTFNSQGVSSVISTPRRKFLNIEQWTDAFATYSSVLRIKFPELSDPLAQYCATIRSIARKQGNWFSYDVNFRKLKQHADMPWNVIQHELYFNALGPRQPFRAQPFLDGKDSAKPDRSPRDKSTYTCNKYNKGVSCSGCSYRHACKLCGGTHPLFKCWKRDKADKNASTVSEKVASKPQAFPKALPPASKAGGPKLT